jgi:hypothetical protein
MDYPSRNIFCDESTKKFSSSDSKKVYLVKNILFLLIFHSLFLLGKLSVSFIWKIFFNSKHFYLILNRLLFELNISVKQWNLSKKHIMTCQRNKRKSIFKHLSIFEKRTRGFFLNQNFNKYRSSHCVLFIR